MCGVHVATHSYVSEWSQHMQHLQTESESLPNLQTAVLTVQVQASGECHSENEVSLPVLYGRVWVCRYCSSHHFPWSRMPSPSIQLSVFSCCYQTFLLERSHKWYVGPHLLRARSPYCTRRREIRLQSGLRWTRSIAPSIARKGWNFLRGMQIDKHGSVLLRSVCRSTGKGILVQILGGNCNRWWVCICHGGPSNSVIFC